MQGSHCTDGNTEAREERGVRTTGGGSARMEGGLEPEPSCLLSGASLYHRLHDPWWTEPRW